VEDEARTRHSPVADHRGDELDGEAATVAGTGKTLK
jgi:hypothetical protein